MNILTSNLPLDNSFFSNSSSKRDTNSLGKNNSNFSSFKTNLKNNFSSMNYSEIISNSLSSNYTPLYSATINKTKKMLSLIPLHILASQTNIDILFNIEIENKYNSKLNEYVDQYHEICRNYNEQCKLIIKNAPKEEKKQLIAELKSDKKNKIKALNQKIYNTRYEYSLAYAKFNENLKYKKQNEKKTKPTPKKRKSKK